MSQASASSATVVIYSGGMDSFTVLHRALREGRDVHALSFDYGQRHARELEVARRVCRELTVPHQVVDIRAIHGLIDNSALTDADRRMPDGDYDADNLADTVVPNRNMMLLSMAIAKAVNIGAGRVDYGAHGGDHVLYPDCRPEFVEAMNAVAGIANFEPVEIHTPYLRRTKPRSWPTGSPWAWTTPTPGPATWRISRLRSLWQLSGAPGGLRRQRHRRPSRLFISSEPVADAPSEGEHDV